MTTGLINRGRSLSLQLQLAEFRFNHAIFLLLFFLFRPMPLTLAQPGIFPPPGHPPSSPLNYSQKFNPPLAIIMIALVSSFFVMGFFSVYIRHCSGRRSRGGPILNPSVASVLGGGRRSRRAPVGLDKSVIESTFPTFLYSAVKGLKIGKGSLECAVCLSEFEDDDTLRLIPKCSHVFHPDCVGEWLASHTTCPVCRANLVPKPGDVALGSVLSAEPNIWLQQNQQTNAGDQTGDEVVIRVADDNTNQDREREEEQAQFSDANLLNPVQKNRPPRSWSTGWQLGRLFPRSHSTGHSLVQPGENFERFTLRLPEEVRSQLMNTHLHRAQSCVAFPRVSSSRRGYRSRSVGVGSAGNPFHYERFNQEGRPNHFGCSITPPFIATTGSVRSSKGQPGPESDEVNASTLKRFSRSVRSPLDRFFSGTDIGTNENREADGEPSSDRLRPDSHV